MRLRLQMGLMQLQVRGLERVGTQHPPGHPDAVSVGTLIAVLVGMACAAQNPALSHQNSTTMVTAQVTRMVLMFSYK